MTVPLSGTKYTKISYLSSNTLKGIMPIYSEYDLTNF